MNIIKNTKPASSSSKRLAKSVEGEIRRPLLSKINFFGFKIKRWAVAEENTLLVYKSRRSQIYCKKIPLKDAKIEFPTKVISNQKFKPSEASFKLTYQDKLIYYLQPLDYEDYLHLKMILELAQSGYEQRILTKNVKKEVIQVNQASPQTSGLLVSPTAQNQIDKEWDERFEEDLLEDSDLENTISYNMSFYSNSAVHRKSNLELKTKSQHMKSKKQNKFIRMPSDEEISEGSRYSTIPQSNFNISELKTRRGVRRESIDHIVDMNVSDMQASHKKISKSKFLRSATAFVGRLSNQRKESFPENTLNDLGLGSKQERLTCSQNNKEEVVVPSPKVADQYEFFGPRLVSKRSPLEQLLQDGDSDVLLKTLSYAREVLEDEEDLNMMVRMQSKKENLIARNSTLAEKRNGDSFKHYISREIYSLYAEGNQEENLRTKLDSKKADKSLADRTPTERTLDHAFELIQNFELKEAKELFLSLSIENPRLKLFAIECDLIVLSLNGFKDLVDSCLQELSQLAMQLMHMPSSLKSNTNLHFENEITKAESIIFKGILNVVLNYKWQAFLCISESWRIVKKLEVQIKDSKIQEALSTEVLHRILFAIGAFNLAFSLVPPTLKKILKIIGITPNKELGLLNLQKCWETKFSRSMYAALFISCYHLEFELDSLKACDVIEKAMVQYNRFPLFSWVGALLSWRFFQPQDVETLVKSGLEKCAETIQNPIFLTYELGWYYFITCKWEPALDVFLKLISGILKPQFFKNFNHDLHQMAKTLRNKCINIPLNFGPFPFQEARYALFPHLTHILLNISACYYEINNMQESNRWLVAALIANKKYLNYQNKIENDFGRLAEKFLKRKCRKMLVFELLYFLKQLVKLPDPNLQDIIGQVDKHLKSLLINPERSQNFPSSADELIEYLSGMLIITVSNCMMGETQLVISTSDRLLSFVEHVPFDYSYLAQHILYWFGRAAIAEGNLKMAAAMFKKAIKVKANEFNFAEKSRKLIQQHNL